MIGDDVSRNAAVVRKISALDDGGNAWALIFDTVLKADIKLATKVTSNPVADGSPISDHAYDEQPKVSISVGVSNVTPLELLGYQSIAQHEEAGDADDLGDFWREPGQTRSQVALANLDWLRRDHQLCGLTLGLMSFENMFLTDIRCVEDMEKAEVLVAELEFVGVRVTQVQVTKYPPRDKKTGRSTAQAKKKKVAGKQPTTTELREAYYQRLMTGKLGNYSSTEARDIAKFRYPDEGAPPS